jgi:tRNA (guanine-N7-)-methyltransferase
MGCWQSGETAWAPAYFSLATPRPHCERATPVNGTEITEDGIEYEFGVPFPGRILEPHLWAKTALKKMPEGWLNWDELFGRPGPVLIDIGVGNGRSALTHAYRQPECNILAVDILPVVIRYATRRGNQRGLPQLRFAVIGGRELLERHVPAASVAEIHCYHPQPYYRSDEISRRMVTPDFLRLVWLALNPGGKFVLQTDHPAYWAYMKEICSVFFEFTDHPAPWPDAPEGRSRREMIARSQGLTIFRGVGIKREDLDPAQAASLAQSLPLPVFNADRRLIELDAIDGGKPQRRPRRR